MNEVTKTIVYCVSVLIVLFVLKTLIENIKENLLPYDPKVDELKRKLLLVSDRANEIQFFTDKKSYTINKKKCIYV